MFCWNVCSSCIQRQVFSALSQIAKHSASLSEMVAEVGVFPAAMTCLKDPDEYVRKNVTTLMREMVKQTAEVVEAPSFSHKSRTDFPFGDQ